ncbi:MAG: exodeoxyribonuclease VII large subunit [Desulfobacterales bacterium]|jgi:exodeoxyribonuclease VII large subunit
MPKAPQALAHIYTVSELNRKIKAILEQNFPFIWISGEISNFRMPSSGHFYFTLKDETSQIQTVMFRGQNQNLKFVPEDGMSVTGLGRIGVFEPRGSYQVILEYLEPKGVGALQVAFEQLKKKLEDEGLFDEQYKKPLPFLPQKIGLITSPTGAVLHDILHVINRRFPGIPLDIVPVKVQGDGANADIVAAVELLNRLRSVDVIILARGGGSLEDLQAFNSEAVARAIFASEIPIISAVGHETDYTISDFAADLRAPTPSAAAELVVPIKGDLYRKINELRYLIILNLQRYIKNYRSQVTSLRERLADPKKKVNDHRLTLDEDAGRLIRAMMNQVHMRRERLAWRFDKLSYNNPSFYVTKLKEKLNVTMSLLHQSIQSCVSSRQARLREVYAKLDSLNPTAILARGFSITRTLSETAIVRDSATVSRGQALEIVLARGSLTCDVKEKFKNGKKIV